MRRWMVALIPLVIFNCEIRSVPNNTVVDTDFSVTEELCMNSCAYTTDYNGCSGKTMTHRKDYAGYKHNHETHTCQCYFRLDVDPPSKEDKP